MGGSSVDACTPCPAGSYSDQTGVTNASCSPCPVNRWSTQVGLVAASQCLPCPIGTYFPGTGSDSEDNCRGCGANTFMRAPPPGANESDGVCLPCGANQAAPQGATSPDACKCVAGFINEGTLSCAVCPADSYCPGEDVLLSCGLNKTSPPQSTSQSDCTCKSGYRLNSNNQCETCDAGEYMDDATRVCVLCPSGFFCADGVLPARCPLKSSSLVGAQRRGDCFCDPGLEGDLSDENEECAPCDSLGTCAQTQNTVFVSVEVEGNMFAAASQSDPDAVDFLAQQAWAAMSGDSAQEVVPKTTVFSGMAISTKLQASGGARRRRLLAFSDVYQDGTKDIKTEAGPDVQLALTDSNTGDITSNQQSGPSRRILSTDTNVISQDMLTAIDQAIKTEAGPDVQLDPITTHAKFTGLFLASQLNIDLPCMQAWAAAAYAEIPGILTDYMRDVFNVAPVYVKPHPTGLVLDVTVADIPGRPNDFLVTAAFDPQRFIAHHATKMEWSLASNNWVQDALSTIVFGSKPQCAGLTKTFALELQAGGVVGCRDSATGQCTPSALVALLGFDLLQAPTCAHCFGDATADCARLNQTTCKAVVPPAGAGQRRRLLNTNECAGKEVYWLQARLDGVPKYVKFVYDPAAGSFRAKVDDTPEAYNTCVDYAQAAACDCAVERDDPGASFNTILAGSFDLLQTPPEEQTEVDVDIGISGESESAAFMMHFTNDAFFDVLIQGAFRAFSLDVLRTTKETVATGFKFEVANVTDTGVVSRLSDAVAANQEALQQEFALVGLQTRGAVLRAVSVRVECEANEVLSVAEERCVCNRFSVLDNATAVCKACAAGYYTDAPDAACTLCPPNHYCPTPAQTNEDRVLVPCLAGRTSIAGRTRPDECRLPAATMLTFDVHVGSTQLNLQNLALAQPAAVLAEAVDGGGAGLHQTRVARLGFWSYWRCAHANLSRWVDTPGENHLLAYSDRALTVNASESDIVLKTHIPMKHERQHEALVNSGVCPSGAQFVRSLIKLQSLIQDVDASPALFDPAFVHRLKVAVGRVYGGFDASLFPADFQLQHFQQQQPIALGCRAEDDEVEYLGRCVCAENFVRGADGKCAPCPGGKYRLQTQAACAWCEENFECPFRQERRPCTGGKVARVGSQFCRCPDAHYLYSGICFPCTPQQKCEEEQASTEITLEYPAAVQGDVAVVYSSAAFADFGGEPCPGHFQAYGLVVEAFRQVPAGDSAGNLTAWLRVVDTVSAAGLFTLRGRDLALACRVGMTVSGRITQAFLVSLLDNEVGRPSTPRLSVVQRGAGEEISLEFFYNVTTTAAPAVDALHQAFQLLHGERFHSDDSFLVHINSVTTRVLANFSVGMNALTTLPNAQIRDGAKAYGFETRPPLLRQCVLVPGGVRAADVAAYQDKGVRVVSVLHDTRPIPTCEYGMRDQDGFCVCPDGFTRRLDRRQNQFVCDLCGAGLHATDSVLCVPCKENFFCPGNGLQTACPAHAFSQGGSTALSDCECFGGYIKIHEGICDSCALPQLRDTAACQGDERLFALLKTAVHGYAARFPGVPDVYAAHQDMLWAQFTAAIRQYAQTLLLRSGSDAAVAPRGVSVEYVVNHTYFAYSTPGGARNVSVDDTTCSPLHQTKPVVRVPEARYAVLNCSLPDKASDAEAADAHANFAAALAEDESVERGGGCRVQTAGRWPSRRLEAFCPELAADHVPDLHRTLQGVMQGEQTGCSESLAIALVKHVSIEQDRRCGLDRVCPDSRDCALHAVHAVLEIASTDRTVIDGLAAAMSNESEKVAAGVHNEGPVQLRVGASAYGGRRRVSCATVLAGSFLVDGACVCPAGRYKGGGATPECLPCPFNHWCADNKMVACDQQAPLVYAEYMWRSESECLCRAGFYGGGSACHRCPAGSYCPGSLQRTPVACPDSRPLSGVGAQAETECVNPHSSTVLRVDVALRRAWQSGAYLSRLDLERMARDEFRAPAANLSLVAGVATVAFEVLPANKVVNLPQVASFRSLLQSVGMDMGNVTLVRLQFGNQTAAADTDVLSVDASGGGQVELVLNVTEQDLSPLKRPYASAIWVDKTLLQAWEELLCQHDLQFTACAGLDVVDVATDTTDMRVAFDILLPSSLPRPVNASTHPLTRQFDHLFPADEDTAFTISLSPLQIDPAKCAVGAVARNTKCRCGYGYECSVPPDAVEGCVKAVNVSCVKRDPDGSGGGGGSGGGSGGEQGGTTATRDDSLIFTVCYIVYFVFILALHTYALFYHRQYHLLVRW